MGAFAVDGLAACAPQRLRSVASAPIGDHLLLADERSAQPIVLSPVGAALWSFLDGSTTVASLLADVETTLGASAQGDALDLLRELDDRGFIHLGEPREANQVLAPRRIEPPIDPASCVGKRIGVGRAEVVEVEVGGHPIVRFGATDAAVVADVVARLPVGASVVAPSLRPLRTLVLRVTRGRVARLQQLFDALGAVLWAGNEVEPALEALERSVLGVLRHATDATSVWIRGPVLLGPGGAVVLHPALAEHATGRWRRDLAARGMTFVPSSLVALESTAEGPLRLVLPALDGEHEPPSLTVAAVAVPATGPGRYEVVRHLAHVMATWDDAHLAGAVLLGTRTRVASLPVTTDDASAVEGLADLVARPR